MARANAGPATPPRAKLGAELRPQPPHPSAAALLSLETRVSLRASGLARLMVLLLPQPSQCCDYIWMPRCQSAASNIQRSARIPPHFYHAPVAMLSPSHPLTPLNYYWPLTALTGAEDSGTRHSERCSATELSCFHKWTTMSHCGCNNSRAFRRSKPGLSGAWPLCTHSSGSVLAVTIPVTPTCL